MNKKYEIKNGWLIINRLGERHNGEYRSCRLSSISYMCGYKIGREGFSIKLLYTGWDPRTEILYTEDEKDIFLSDLNYLQELLMNTSN